MPIGEKLQGAVHSRSGVKDEQRHEHSGSVGHQGDQLSNKGERASVALQQQNNPGLFEIRLNISTKGGCLVAQIRYLRRKGSCLPCKPRGQSAV
jgi:hypothetical protein